jgi:hypothetical protein
MLHRYSTPLRETTVSTRSSGLLFGRSTILRLGDDGACACLALLAAVASSPSSSLAAKTPPPCTESEHTTSGSGGASGSRSAECVGRGARGPRPAGCGALPDSVATFCAVVELMRLLDGIIAGLPGERRWRDGEPPAPAFTGPPSCTDRGSARARGGGGRLTPGVGRPMALLLAWCVGNMPETSTPDGVGADGCRTSQLPRRVRGDSAR